MDNDQATAADPRRVVSKINHDGKRVYAYFTRHGFLTWVPKGLATVFESQAEAEQRVFSGASHITILPFVEGES